MLVWVLAIAVYALPYVAAGLLSPVQAVFESTSGLTTTGLSVVDVDTCPAIFLFHRSLTCYLGGVGLVHKLQANRVDELLVLLHQTGKFFICQFPHLLSL